MDTSFCRKTAPQRKRVIIGQNQSWVALQPLPLGESGVCKRSGKSCGVVRAQGVVRASARAIFCEVRRGAAPLSWVDNRHYVLGNLE